MTIQHIVDGKTLVPVGIVVSVAGGLIGWVIWLTTMYNGLTAQASSLKDQQAQISKLSDRQDKYNDDVNQIRIELERINGRLSLILRRQGD